MKKTLLITFASAALAVTAFGQGQIAFTANSTTGLIDYSTDGLTVAGAYPKSPGVTGFGNANVGFFAAPNGTVLTLGANGLPDFSSWTAVSTVLSILPTGSGKAQNLTINLPGTFTAGNNVELEVVGWTGTATSWAAALAQDPNATLYGFSGSILSGGTLGWSQPTGNPNSTPTPGTPQNVVTGVGGYSGLVLAPPTVPEPSTLVLGGLGAAALLAFRRRK